MVPNWLLIVVLVANVAVTLYLKPWVQVANWFASVRLMRQINAFRVAGLLLLLVAVPALPAHAQQIVGSAGYSDGDALLAQQFQQRAKPDAFDQMVWNNWFWFVGGAVAIFLFLQFAGGKESNDTDVEDMLDPDYRTGFVTNYHGDEAFIVPDGMNSEYEPVPVRSRRAAAGR